jgi:hypothetical protein
MHVEAGYDANGNLVMNLYLNPSTANPYAVSISPVGVVRYAQGQITLFDTNNVPILPVLPNSSMTALLPPSFLVSNKGASLIGNLRVSNIQRFAAAQNAALSVQGNIASITLPKNSGPQVVWTYAQSGAYWVPQQVQFTPTVANSAVTHTLQFSNLAVSDNATKDAGLMNWMNAIDNIWNTFTGCNFSQFYCEGSDGLVQFSSQQYPSPSAMQVAINGGDAHGGATKSNYDRAALDTILAQKFYVLSPASCNYSTAPVAFTLSASGGTETFNVTTSQGCQWSATSNQPWLTVNTQTGASSGTVSFTVLPNPLNTPLQAVISVGSSTSAATVSVIEAGVCSYSLSPGPEIAVPGTGGTGTIAVSTQTGCVWSAVSSASWLTISSATGTGSGSFQYTAAVNNTGSDLLATVAVANQTLNILQGTSSGAAGTGTVTIIGSPQSTTVNECPGNPYGPCMVKIWEPGAVIVSVNGQSYSVQYDGSSSSSALAASLAALMNTPSSLITATASGSTVTITATVDGTATDYSLTTSYAFDTHDFAGPAFQATASGPFLTGGAN